MSEIRNQPQPSSRLGRERAFVQCPACRRGYLAGSTECALDGELLRPIWGVTLIGDTVAGRYRVEQLLGAGGMGEVYKATHIVLGRPVALKVLLPGFAESPKAMAMLQREARNANRVEHPNAVRIFDLERDGELTFLTMDYVPGPTLLDVVEVAGALSPAMTCEVLHQVALGLEAIHATGIVHRDLKPSNVVLTRKGDGRGVAKLLDFGIARAFDEPDQALTLTGLTVGTPGYMSPEQRAGLVLDRRADVFSLAVLAVFLLAGRLPNVPPASCLRLVDVPEAAKWPEQWRQALNAGLMLERNHRVSSALRFAAGVQEAMADFSPGDGRPASIDAELRRPRWRRGELMSGGHPTPVIGAAAVPLAIQTEVIAALDSTTPASGPRPAVTGPRLEAITGPLQDKWWSVGDTPVLLGRDPKECVVRFPADSTVISRIHASVWWDARSGRFMLQDEGSRNATFTEDGRRLDAGVPVALEPGATFCVGAANMRFRVRAD